MTDIASPVCAGEQIIEEIIQDARTPEPPVFVKLAEILDGVFSNTSTINPYWYGKASILRSIFFRKRIGLEFDKKYLSNDDSLCLHRTNICKALTEKHPDKTAKEIAIKFCDHAMQNDIQWSKSVGIPTLYSKLTGQTSPIRLSERSRTIPTNSYRINDVRAEDVAYGTVSYSERRYYRADMEIPEDVIQEAVNQDDVNVIFDWLEEAMGEEDPYDYEGPEYGDTDMEGSEDFCLTDRNDLRARIRDLMDEYQANNPPDEEEEED